MDTNPWPVAPSTLGTPPESHFKTPKIQNLGDLLDFQRAAIQEAIFHKGTSDANRAELRRVMARMPNSATLPAAYVGILIPELYKLGAQHYDQLPHWAQGIYDAILDTGTDPLTLETADTGALAKVGLRAFGPVVKAIDRSNVPVWGPGLISDISKAGTRLLNFGGEAINTLGRGKWMQAVGMLNRQRGESRELFRRLKAIDAKAMAGLTPAQTSRVQKVLNGQLLSTKNGARLEAAVMRDPMVAQAVRARKTLTDNLVRMQAQFGSDIEERLGGKALPAELHPFAGHPGEFGTANYRGRYFPGHNYEKEVDANQPARDISLLDSGNPHVKEREALHITSKRVEEFEHAFEGMLKTSARAITANKAGNELAKIYGSYANIPKEIRDIFTVHVPATGTARTVGQKAQEAIKGLVNLPKLGIVGTTPIHMFNILSLLLGRAPEQVPLAALHMARIVRAGGDEGKRFEAMLPAIERGIDVATHEKDVYPILSKLRTGALNRWTWDWDTAAKLALSDKYIKAGMHPIEAGVKASNELVNYANRSPLTGFLQWFMPFATFAEGGAKSVLSSVAHAPPLVELENRLTGGRFLGGGKPKKDVTLYQPPANVGRALPMPKGKYDNAFTEAATLPARMALPYIRSKTSDLLKLPVGGLLDLIPGGQSASKWVLSGRTPLGTAADIVTSPVPYARDILDLIPIHHGKTIRGYAPDQPLNQAIFSSTGISLPTKPKKAPLSVAAPASGDPNNPWPVSVPAASATPGATAAPRSIGKPPANPWPIASPPP